MKTKNFFSLFILVVAFSFASCDKEDEKPPYVGTWETNLFTMQVSQTTSIEQKMSFVFTETDFTTEISMYVADPGVFVQMLGVKGTIDEKENQTLAVSLTDIGQWNSAENNYAWKNRTTNSAEFDGLYSTYLATSMLKDFDAVYDVQGTNLDLIVAAVNDTIHLHK